MQRESYEDDEPLAQGITPSSGMFELPADVAALRERLLVQTTGIVTGGVRRKRFSRVAGWALAYAAGLATAWFGLERFNYQAPQAAQVAARPNAVAAPAAELKSEPAPAQRRITPEGLRLRVAGASRDNQIELLKQAGDLYLRERNDLRSAVQCYQQVLELSERPEQLAVLSEDSWLLAELKSARQSQ